MRHSYKIEPQENLVLNTIIGGFTFHEYRNLMESIMNDENFKPSMNMFWDFSEGTLGEFSIEEIDGIRFYIEDNIERRGTNYRVAFFVKDTLDYGLSRMYQMVSDELPVHLEVFYDKQEALDWIRAKQ